MEECSLTHRRRWRSANLENEYTLKSGAPLDSSLGVPQPGVTGFAVECHFHDNDRPPIIVRHLPDANPLFAPLAVFLSVIFAIFSSSLLMALKILFERCDTHRREP